MLCVKSFARDVIYVAAVTFAHGSLQVAGSCGKQIVIELDVHKWGVMLLQ